MKKYLPADFEQKWAKEWDKNKIYKAPSLKSKVKSQKSYIFPMFPYPSGAGLHVGHVRVYTGTDVIARFYRMNQYAVLHPMGWDAFGLPAENAAIKAKKNPMDMVPDHIVTFKRQMKMLGFSYDWDREFATTDPSYYKWTQWLFLQFYKMGLLYKKNIPINFCPSCKTGLAEEEVLANGTHERCGNKIEKKDLPQWLFKITSYADRLLEDLESLDWPRGILEMQKNWIGKKEGVNIEYSVFGIQYSVKCFTTRPDTNFGATFVVIAPEHEFVKKILNGEFKVEEKVKNEIKEYVEKAKGKTEIERETEGRKKTGVFTGYYAINQLSGYKMPIWISDFVLMGFGTGSVIGVPGHDDRDLEFAKEFNLPVIQVIKPNVVIRDVNTGETREEAIRKTEENIKNYKKAYDGPGAIINSGDWNNLIWPDNKESIFKYLEDKKIGKRKTTYHLRDWIFSRQRYWGEPIPMIFCENCAENQTQNSNVKVQNQNSKLKTNNNETIEQLSNEMAGWIPVPENELPVKLPYVQSYEPSGTGESPLAAITDWVNVKCPKCGGPARRETDTMPNWAGSCWYFIAFAFWKKRDESPEILSRLNSSLPLVKQKVSKNFGSSSPSIENCLHSETSVKEWKLKIENYGSKWLPGDWYIGGAEHAVLHLLYARFWVKALYDLKLLNFKEPFTKLRNLGMILAEDHRKMSKSFGNVINPDDVVKEFGADALRIYEMFMAPFDQEIAWSTNALQGAYRFMNRVWKLFQQYQKSKIKYQNDRSKFKIKNNLTMQQFSNENFEDKQLVSKLYKTISKVTNDIPDVKFNTAIAAMMEFINAWEQSIHPKSTASVDFGLSERHAKQFLQILAPFAPFTTEEIWHEVFGEKDSIHLSTWPKVDTDLIGVNEEVVIPVQINGKLRATIKISTSNLSETAVINRSLKDEKVKKYLEGKKYKVIYVKGKILNFVI